MKVPSRLYFGALAWLFMPVCQCQGGEALLTTPITYRNAQSIETDNAIQVRSLSTVMDELPSCAKSCVQQMSDGQDCSDGTCLCSTKAIQSELQNCVTAACTIAEGIQTMTITQNTCNLPPRNRATSYNVTSITLATITGLLVMARLNFKIFFSYLGRLGADDWFIIASIAIGLPCTILNGVGFTRHGLGKDVWTLPPSMVEDFGRYFYTQQILYIFLVSANKLSLLFFYRSIFPGPRVRLVIWCTITAASLFGLIFMIMAVFQCTPIDFYWLRYSQPIEGRCTRINLIGWVHGCLSVGLDIWMICIPLLQIRNLELHWKKKIGAAIMFITGTFVTIVSALRLRSLIYFANSINPTWDEWEIALWSTIEINVGLMCACLPTLRLILVRIWPRVFGSSLRSALSYPSGTSHATKDRASWKQQVRLGTAESGHASTPLSPHLNRADAAFELDAKYPVSDNEVPDGPESPDNSKFFEQGCHAK